jgi:hypothetical protein
MRNRVGVLTSVLVSVLGSAIVLGGWAGVAGAQQSAKTDGSFLVFAVERWETEYWVDPIVRVNANGTFAEPVSNAGGGSKTKTAAFIQRYLLPGKSYRVLFGSVPGGTATMKEKPGDPEISFAVSANVKSSVVIKDPVRALATDFSSRKNEATTSLRRPATASEHAKALALARTSLAKYGLGTADAGKTKEVYLAAINLDKQGPHELVGQFHVMAGKVAHEIFLIAEPDGAGGYRAAHVWHSQNHTETQEGEHTEQALVDALDLNGDGISEVIVRSSYYESHDYSIYQKKRGGAWKAVYRGAGGGV